MSQTPKQSPFPVPLLGMKKIHHRAALLLGCLLGLFVSGCFASAFVRDLGYVPGVYEGQGRGYRGPIHVRVQISPGGIEDIEITRHGESPFPGLAAMEELLEGVLETGSTDLDLISGASFSSRGFLEAVEDALGKM